MIGFSGEAHDAAGRIYREIKGWIATVVEADGTTYDAEVGDLSIDDETGFQMCEFRVWNEELNVPSGVIRTLDIYTDIDSITVI